MKRVLLSLTGTVVGLVALLDFKSHQTPVGGAAALTPAVPNGAASTTPARRSAPRRTTAPSGTSGRRTSGTSASGTSASGTSASGTSKAAGGRFVGDAVQTQYGVVQVAVTTSPGRIDKVSFVQLTAFDQHSAEINSQAAPILVQETLSAQSAHIDSVSGATYTSAGYLQSLQSALDRAGLQ